MWPDDFARRYRERGYWTGETLDSVLLGKDDQIAVVDGRTRISYADLRSRAQKLAAGLYAEGINPGDRVVVQLSNVPAFFDTVFALFRLGALPVFALPAHRESEIGYFCEHTDAAAFITEHPGLAPKTRTIAADELTALSRDGDLPPRPKAEERAFLQLSGGSTGLPKLIPRTHDDYLYSVRASAGICALTPDSVYLAALPVAHNFTMSSPGFLGALHAGGTVVLAPSPAPGVVLPLIAAERVTIVAAVPPLAQVWLDAAAAGEHDLSSLEVLQVGGAKLGSEVAARVTPTLGCRLQQVFGMAEGLVNYTRLGDPDDVVLHTQGRPISPDDELLVVDDEDRPVAPGTVGHLLTRGPYTIRGYWRAEEHNRTAFTADGFYRTGDLVRIRDDGYLVVEGRAKDQINRGGEKIAAEEVENHLLAHPAVRDAAIVAVPDAYLGERSCAFVLVRPGHDAPKLSDLKRHLRERGVAAYKTPDLVRVLDAFPATGVGKTSRRDLRRLLQQSDPRGE